MPLKSITGASALSVAPAGTFIVAPPSRVTTPPLPGTRVFLVGADAVVFGAAVVEPLGAALADALGVAPVDLLVSHPAKTARGMTSTPIQTRV